MSHPSAEALIAPADAGGPVVPVHAVTEAEFAALAGKGAKGLKSLADLHEFKGQAGRLLLVPDAKGALEKVIFGLGAGAAGAMAIRALPGKLPAGAFSLAAPGLDPALAAFAWAIGAYGFDRYKAEHSPPKARLVLARGLDLKALRLQAHACALARDMVNTPANDMGPRQIETVAREIAETYGAKIAVTTGEALVEENYPAVHAVGRAAVEARAPRMIELSWKGPGAKKAAPLIALVGKGVVFDTGGLDIKPSAGMRLMKKDMAGAAHALALARMIMGARLPVRLTVLVPAVENAIAGDAMRPGDVIGSRKGLTIEIGNTDAEGRLILADALTRADELQPDLTLDFATLTGAARAALGPEVVPFYTADDALAGQVAAAAAAVSDPLWRMPLWEGYADSLNSEVADLKNDPDAWAQAGSVTAALFLRRFAPRSGAWVHFDIFGWSARARPGWPAGAEVQAIRAMHRVIAERYGA